MPTETPPHLRPLAPYHQLYTDAPRAFAFPQTSDAAEWERWRGAFRDRLRARLGDLPAARPRPEVVAGPSEQLPGYTRTYLEYRSGPGLRVPAWLLVPNGLAGPSPAVVALHGHGYGMDSLVGLDPQGNQREEPDGFHQHLAVALCRRGMIVLAPELAGFGRRREPAHVDPANPASNSCHLAAWWGIMLGKPLLGGRVWDALQAFDLLQGMPQVDPARVGLIGGSGGGAVALLTAGLEPGLRAAVICCYFCTFRDSILAMPHCHCNYVPGLLDDGEMYDLAALIAPRPLMIEAGSEDPIFPLHGVEEGYARLSQAYALAGAAGRLARDIFPGGHQISGRHSYDFLRRELGSDA